MQIGSKLTLRRRRDSEIKEGEIKHIYPRYVVVEFISVIRKRKLRSVF